LCQKLGFVLVSTAGAALCREGGDAHYKVTELEVLGCLLLS